MDPHSVFCPNPDCPARGQTEQKNISIHSRKEARYKCEVCQSTFSARKGTAYYRLQHDRELVTQVITLLAHGCPLQAIVAAFGLDERTVANWQARAGQHSQQVHEHLVEQPRDLEHVQADEIRVKAQGITLWVAMAILVKTRLWLGAVISPTRDGNLIARLIEQIRRCALARFPLLICVDGLASYVTAIREGFRSPVHTGAKGRPLLAAWPNILIGQVIKQYQGKRVVGVIRRMAQGSAALAQRLLASSRGGIQINTAFIERINATFRSRLASLARRTRNLVANPETLTPAVYLIGSVYNFCTPHKSLRVKLSIGERGHCWVQRTPAMATQLTDHCWSVKELLSFRVPLPPWEPPKHRGRRSAAEKALIERWCR